MHSSNQSADLALPELIAGKTKALFDRVAVRDLYDIYRVSRNHNVADGPSDTQLLHHRVILHYVSLSNPFPCPIDGTVTDKFANRSKEVESSLCPMLRADERPTLEEMIVSAKDLVARHVAPRDPDEEEYLRRLDEDSEYAPELLFEAWPEVLERARVSPAAAWKVLNLKKRHDP